MPSFSHLDTSLEWYELDIVGGIAEQMPQRGRMAELPFLFWLTPPQGS